MSKAIVCIVLLTAAAWAAPSEIESFVRRQGKAAGKPASLNRCLQGDLDGDGRADTVAHYIVQTGYPGNDFLSYIAVFRNAGHGKLSYVSQIPAGAKLAPGLVPTAVRQGQLLCDRYAPNGLEKTGSTRFRLRQGKLQEQR